MLFSLKSISHNSLISVHKDSPLSPLLLHITQLCGCIIVNSGNPMVLICELFLAFAIQTIPKWESFFIRHFQHVWVRIPGPKYKCSCTLVRFGKSSSVGFVPNSNPVGSAWEYLFPYSLTNGVCCSLGFASLVLEEAYPIAFEIELLFLCKRTICTMSMTYLFMYFGNIREENTGLEVGHLGTIITLD